MNDHDNPANDDETDDDIAAQIAEANAARDSEADDGNGERAEGDNDPQAEISALKDQVLRLAAELENTRRRAEREKADGARYAIANFARDLLSVADNFERALSVAPEEGAEASPETLAGLVTGLKMTDNELRAVLQRHGVKQINPKGEKFDPNLHQAVAQAPSEVPAGHVADVAQSGFIIGERVLRAAMVVVSTGAPAAEGGEASGAGAAPVGSKIDTQA